MNVQIVLVGSDNWLSSLKRCWSFLRFRQGRRKHNAALSIEINLKRGLWFCAVAGIALYLLGGLALYGYRSRMPHNQITYLDILMAPIDMKTVVKKQGRMQIMQARDDLKKGKVRESFFKYRSGIRRVPEDQLARLELAQFFIAAGMIPRATDLLVEGLDYGFPDDPRYLRVLLMLTQHTDNNPALLEALPIILDFPQVQANKETRVAMLQLLLRAQIVERDFAGVIETSIKLNNEELSKHYHDTIMYAYLKMGSFEQAEEHLQGLPENIVNDPTMTLLKGYLLQVKGESVEARNIFYSIFRETPTAWRSQMDAILLLVQNGDDAAAFSLLDLYIALHRRNGSALTSIAAQFTDLPDSENVRRVMDRTRADVPELLGTMWFYYIQALVTEGEFEAAQKQMNLLAPAAPKDPQFASIFEAYQAIINAAIARSAGEKRTLVKVLETNRLPAEVYWEAGEAMRKVTAYETAELALNAGLNEYPFSQSLSKLRTAILKEKQNADFRSSQVIASVRDQGYDNQSLKADPLESRLAGESQQTSAMESLVGEEKLEGFTISEEDINKSGF